MFCHLVFYLKTILCHNFAAAAAASGDRLKDGMVAAEQCSRYHMDGSSLVIRDVAEEDAGQYTVLAGIREHGLLQNLTLTLVVNGEKRNLCTHTVVGGINTAMWW